MRFWCQRKKVNKIAVGTPFALPKMTGCECPNSKFLNKFASLPHCQKCQSNAIAQLHDTRSKTREAAPIPKDKAGYVAWRSICDVNGVFRVEFW